MTRVLICVDETDESVAAAQRAYALFGEDAEYLALNVADVRLDAVAAPSWRDRWGVAYPMPFGAVWPYQPYPGATAEAGAVDAEAAASIAAHDVHAQLERSGITDAEPMAEVGDAADVILETASERDVDVIVVGSHQRGWFDRLLNPSVSREVLKRAEVPVLVVK